MIKFLTLLLCLQTLQSHAQAELDLPKDELSTFTEKDLEKIDSMKRGTVLKQRNIETGIFQNDHNTYKDKNRTSFLYHVNNDLSAITNISTLEFNYAHKFELAWLELFVLRTSGKFGELTDNNPSDFSSTPELEDTDESLLSVGASLSYRSNWVQSLVDSDKMFTTTAAGLGWYTLNEEFSGQSYAGPGLKTDFGLHIRSSRSMHYGARVSYHLASVKRAQEIDTERSSQRSLTLSWLTIGFDLSFYF